MLCQCTSLVRQARRREHPAKATCVQVRVSVAGPEPGYIATPIFVVQAAAELLANRAKIAEATGGQGGVLTPGQLLLMQSDGYVERLKGAGIAVTQSRLQR